MLFSSSRSPKSSTGSGAADSSSRPAPKNTPSFLSRYVQRIITCDDHLSGLGR